MINHSQPALSEHLTTPALLEREADRHGVPVVIVDGCFCAVVYRPSGEAVMWRAVVPVGERAA